MSIIITTAQSSDVSAPFVHTGRSGIDIFANKDLITDLVSYWRFEETSGTARADAFGRNNATAYNDSPTVSGKVGRCASFDGVDQYILGPTKAAANAELNLHGQSLTVACWFKVNTLPSADAEYKALYDMSRGTGGWYTLYLSKFDTTHFRAAGQYIEGTTNFVVDTWYLIWARYDNDTGRLETYLNMNLENSRNDGSWGSAPTTSLRPGIGSNSSSPGSSENLNGFMDELGVWSRYVSVEEMQFFYNAGAGRHAA